MSRNATVVWTNNSETEVSVFFDFDGTGATTVTTGHRTLDHLIETFARYGRFDIKMEINGDGIPHHMFEHAGIALGTSMAVALPDRDKLKRFSRAAIPMEGAIADIAVDVNKNQGWFTFNGMQQLSSIAGQHDGVETFCYINFLENLALKAKFNLYIISIEANDIHHALEVCFKSTAVAIYEASRSDSNPINRLCETVRQE